MRNIACRGRSAGPVALEADPTGTPKHMYAVIGFRPLSVTAQPLSPDGVTETQNQGSHLWSKVKQTQGLV